jgi:hypothetical protein
MKTELAEGMDDEGVNSTDMVTLDAPTVSWLRRTAGMFAPIKPSMMAGKVPEFPFAINTMPFCTMPD